MDREALKAGIDAVMGQSSAADLCHRLVDTLLNLEPSEGRFLTYTSLQNIASVEQITEPLVTAIHFLTSSQWAILKAHGQLIDECGEEFTLSDQDFSDVLAINEVTHPKTGERIQNAQVIVMPFFELKAESGEPSLQ
ncbi:hypothetical protein [Paracoccus sp. (in: a-proteobacteria)]|uniref:hypothetical protein n=1 Tax=Paracoccus sp. TaxID=267 RepID=UPI0028ADA7C3|nr:hypothetical protein [Paracoccus sp. (in: a-proteobacteria)]